MKKRHLLVSLLLLFCCFVTLSPRLLAVSYSIKEVNIDYQIKDDGTAEVKESYLYNFSGSHKGLIYQLDPTALYQVPEGVTFHLDGQAVVENGSKQKGTYTREVRSKMWR